MSNITICLPIMVYISNLFLANQEEVNKYLEGPCKYLKITRRIDFLMTFLVMHITGYRCIYEHEKSYQNLKSIGFSIFRAGKARSILKSISNSMLLNSCQTQE